MQKSGSSPRKQGERRGSKVKPLLTGQITEAEKQVPGHYAPASLVFSPPISHLATCAHLINVLLVTSCKSLIMMLCRYRPHLRACQKHATGHHPPARPRLPTGCSRGLPAGFQSLRQTSQPAQLNSFFKWDFWMHPFHFLHPLML